MTQTQAYGLNTLARFASTLHANHPMPILNPHSLMLRVLVEITTNSQHSDLLILCARLAMVLVSVLIVLLLLLGSQLSTCACAWGGGDGEHEKKNKSGCGVRKKKHKRSSPLRICLNLPGPTLCHSLSHRHGVWGTLKRGGQRRGSHWRAVTTYYYPTLKHHCACDVQVRDVCHERHQDIRHYMHDIEDKRWASIIDVHYAAEVLQVHVKLKVHGKTYYLGEREGSARWTFTTSTTPWSRQSQQDHLSQSTTMPF